MIRSSNPVVQNALIAANTTGGPLFKCKRCGATGNPYDGFCRKCGYILTRDEMLYRAKELIERNLRQRTPHPIVGLAYLKGIGRIDLEIGHKGIGPGQDFGSGLSKILQKHEKDLPKLGMTLVLGKTAGVEDDEIIRTRGDYKLVIGKRDRGGTIVTHYRTK